MKETDPTVKKPAEPAKGMSAALIFVEVRSGHLIRTRCTSTTKTLKRGDGSPSVPPNITRAPHRAIPAELQPRFRANR